MKNAIIIAVVAIVAVATLPWWGSCELNAKACSSWCTVRHFNSDVKSTGCKANCTTERLRCLTRRGADEAEKFLDELKD
jgi:hypothetical protein